MCYFLCISIKDSIIEIIREKPLIVNIYTIIKLFFYLCILILSKFYCANINYILIVPFFIVIFIYFNKIFSEKYFTDDLIIGAYLFLIYYYKILICDFINILAAIFYSIISLIYFAHKITPRYRFRENRYREDLHEIDIQPDDIIEVPINNDLINLQNNILNVSNILNNSNILDNTNILNEENGFTSENYCVICLNTENDNYITFDCNHSFHVSCIEKWINYELYCPICRNKLELSNNSLLNNE